MEACIMHDFSSKSKQTAGTVNGSCIFAAIALYIFIQIVCCIPRVVPTNPNASSCFFNTAKEKRKLVNYIQVQCETNWWKIIIGWKNVKGSKLN